MGLVWYIKVLINVNIQGFDRLVPGRINKEKKRPMNKWFLFDAEHKNEAGQNKTICQ